MTSPFGQKCRLIIQIAGLSDRVEITDTDIGTDKFLKLNPLAKVPVLELDDGSMLADSSVIAAYLASLKDVEKTHPQDPSQKWAALHFEVLADGIIDAGVLVFMEGMRPKNLQSEDWIERQMKKVYAGLDHFEGQISSVKDDDQHIGLLALATGLSWFEIRNVAGDWREGRPNLAAWMDRFVKNDFWLATL